MQTARDAEIFAQAASDQRVIVPADRGFGTLLALRAECYPFVILFRGSGAGDPSASVAVTGELTSRSGDLEKGSLVVFEASG